MTASRDALGNLIESHTYDADGYGVSSTGPTDEISLIEFALAGSVADERVTRVTYKTGATAEYALRAVGNAWRVVRVTGGCGSCGARDATIAHDERGRIVREQDARGYVMQSSYDPVTHNRVAWTTFMQPFGCDPATDAEQCRMPPEELAEVGLLATRSTLATTYEYGDPNWRERPTAVRTESIVHSLLRRHGPSTSDGHEASRVQAMTYDATTGATLTTSDSGWSTGAYQTRTATTSVYDGTEGAAFAPGGGFASAWLSLPQPKGLRKRTDGRARTGRTYTSSCTTRSTVQYRRCCVGVSLR